MQALCPRKSGTAGSPARCRGAQHRRYALICRGRRELVSIARQVVSDAKLVGCSNRRESQNLRQSRRLGFVGPSKGLVLRAHLLVEHLRPMAHV